MRKVRKIKIKRIKIKRVKKIKIKGSKKNKVTSKRERGKKKKGISFTLIEKKEFTDIHIYWSSGEKKKELLREHGPRVEH